MSYFVDIHTHNSHAHSDVIEIVNVDITDTMPSLDVGLYSVGIHPWMVNQCYDVTSLFEVMERCLINENVIAVGEAGLDRCHKDTLAFQKEIFLKEIELSECHRKPLIIHAVRSYSDIIGMRKSSRAVMPWIVHGFRGSLQTAEQLLSHDICLSFGDKSLFDNDMTRMVLEIIPKDKLFFETDVSTSSIEDIYERASVLMEMETDDLIDIVYDNFLKKIYR